MQCGIILRVCILQRDCRRNWNGSQGISSDRQADCDSSYCKCHGSKPLPEGQESEGCLKEKTLFLTVDSEQDISLEMGLLKDKVEFFEEVFGIRLVFRRKRKV